MNSSVSNLTNVNIKKEITDNAEEEINGDKINPNNTIKSNLKFNSELLNKPFGMLKLNNDEKKYSNFDNNNNNYNESSTSGFFRNDNNENNISKISFSGSINFNKSNDFNASLLESKGKRKPFDKLTFNASASDQNNIFDYSNGFGLTTNLNYIDDKNNVDKRDNSDLLIDTKNQNKYSKSKKENLIVENFGKIQSRIKDTLNANRKTDEFNKIESNDNSANLYNKLSESIPNNNFQNNNNNSNLIDINSVINNNSNNNKLQRINTAGNIIQEINSSKINSDNSFNKKSFRHNNNIDDSNSKNQADNKDQSMKNKLKNYKFQDNIGRDSFNNSSARNSGSEENNKKNKKDFSKLAQSASIDKCLEETHLTGIDNLLRNSNNNNNNNQTNLINNNNNNTNSRIQFKNENQISKIDNDSNVSKPKNIQNNLTNSISNIQKNLNETSQLNQSNANNASALNRTFLSKQEQSLIKTSKNKYLSDEVLQKAKLFNNQFDSKVPFWIKFFEDIEQNPDSIQSNSSYFKAENKNKFIKDLIDMVKQDAKLYDASQKEQKKKHEGKEKIRTLLLTEVKLSNANPFADKSELSQSNNTSLTNNSLNAKTARREASNLIPEESKCVSESMEKSMADSNLTQDEIDKSEKLNKTFRAALEGVLNQYEKNEKSENKKKVENFSNFKERLTKKQTVADKYGSKSNDKFNTVIKSAMNRFAYPNLVNIKENLNDDERIFKTIDNLKFPEIFDPFMEIDYSQLQLGYLDKEDLKRLFEIDKRLHDLNPDKYTESINTDLYIMQMEFNEGKNERLKEIEKEYKEKIARIKNKEIKKPSVFDIKQENNEKPKYIDYLQEMKTKKDMKNDLFEIDNKIRIIKNQEISEERKNEIYEDLNLFYAKNPEYYEKEMSKRIPEDYNFDLADSSMKELHSDLSKLKADLVEFEKRITDKDPNKTYEKFEIEKEQEIKQEMIKNYEIAIDMLQKIHLENQEKIKKVEELENKINEDEQIQIQLDQKYQKLIKEKDNFEENMKRLDALLNEEHEFESFIGDNEEDEFDEEKMKNLPFDELEKKAFYELEDI